MDPAAVRKLLRFFPYPDAQGDIVLFAFPLYNPKAELGYFTLMCSLRSKAGVHDEESLNLNLRLISEKVYLLSKHV